MTEAQHDRWAEVLRHLVGTVPAGTATVLVDGAGEHGATVAGWLAEALHRSGHGATVRLAGGSSSSAASSSSRDLVIWLRTDPTRPPSRAARDAEVVIDLHDPTWPVIRHVAARLAGRDRWYVTESRAFFAARAATWDRRFGRDLPAYLAAVMEAGLPRGGTVVDVGCGTGRALPALRAALGPDGTVVGLDLTAQMLAEAGPRAYLERASLVLADARHLPLADGSVDAVFAAGLLMHLPDPEAGLRELSRVTRPRGLLVLFHPAGRRALATPHGRAALEPDPLSEAPLRRSADAAGWRLERYDDPPHRFLVTATRTDIRTDGEGTRRAPSPSLSSP